MARDIPTGPSASFNRMFAMVAETFRSILLNKGAIITVLVLLIPSYIAIYMLLDPPDGSKEWVDIFSVIGLLVFIQFFLLIFPLIYGTHSLNEDIERKTMTYLVTRGNLRMEVFLHRYIGCVLALLPLFTVPIVITYLLFGANGSMDTMADNLDVLIDLLLAVYMGILAYTALFCLIGIAFKRPLVVGLLFSFFWELVMAFIPLRIREFTMMYYVRSILITGNDIWTDIEMESKSATLEGSIILLLFLTGLFLLIGSIMTYRKELD